VSIDPVSIAIEVALLAASTAMTASQKFEGQRLDTVDVNAGDPGAALPRFWGLSRFDGCPIIWAEKLKEKKKTNKTKGGKFVEYKYYGTWAVAIADCEIEALRGIWLDRHLCFQAKDVGPLTPVLGAETIVGGDTDTAPVKLTLGGNMRVYLGTEDQLPDPRYEAWCEDRYGPDTAPAHRGVAYVVFQDIPLEKFGNRIPQVSIEAVRTAIPTFPYEQAATVIGAADSSARFAISPGGQWMARYSDGGIEWWSLPNRTKVGESTISSVVGTKSNIAIAPDGTAYFFGSLIEGVSAVRYLHAISPTGVETLIHSDSIFNIAGPTRVFDTGDGSIRVLTGSGTGYLEFGAQVSDSEASRDFCQHADGSIWGLFQPGGSSNQFTLKDMTGAAGSHVITGLVTRSSISEATFCHVAQFGHFFVVADAKWYAVDDQTFTITASGTPAFGISDDQLALAINNPGSVSFFDLWTEYSLEDASVIRTINPWDWVVETVPQTVYDPVSNALVGPSTSHLTWRYLGRISGQTTLGAIVAEVADWCGVTATDTSALDQVIRGYSVVQGSGRDMIEPLLTAHNSSARPHDFTLQFIKLGAAPSGSTLDTLDDFVAAQGSQRFTVSIAQDTDLPRRATVNFADVGKDYQTNNVIAQRALDAVDSRREQSIDMTTYVATPADMQPIADRWFRAQWFERETITNELTAQQLAIEPGDVRNLALDGRLRGARAEKVTLSGPSVKVEWKRSHASTAALSSGTGAPLDGSDPDTILVPGPTRATVLDIPLVDDAHDATLPQLYYGAGVYVTGQAWPGAALFKGDVEGAHYSDWNDVSSSAGMTWGTAQDAPGNADPWLWDRGNSVTVDVHGGTLSSASEDDIDADPTVNLACLGGELLNFTTATLNGDGSYTLSGFKRGRRGTEWAIADHAAGDEFVLVTGLARQAMGLSEVGVTEYFKGATLGADPATALVISFGFAGATLKPRAPCGFVATRNAGTGDWTFSWTRRTRVGGAWVGGTTIPLGENSEAYELVIPTSTASRTISASSPTATWTSSQQTTDYGAPQTSLPAEIAVYQLSDAVGRGFASEEPIAA
jgi:hypothetical protein